MDQKLGLAQGQIFMVALLLVMVVIYLVAFIFVIFPYLQEAGNDEITDKNDDETANEDNSQDFYNFKDHYIYIEGKLPM